MKAPGMIGGESERRAGTTGPHSGLPARKRIAHIQIFDATPREWLASYRAAVLLPNSHSWRRGGAEAIAHEATGTAGSGDSGAAPGAATGAAEGGNGRGCLRISEKALAEGRSAKALKSQEKEGD